MYNGNYNTNQGTNSCTSRGVCSVSPNIAALSELILSFLGESAHYLLELQKRGVSNDDINKNIVNIFAALITANEYSEKELYDILLDLYYLHNNIKSAYNSVYKDSNQQISVSEFTCEFSEKSSVSHAISCGEKIFLENYKQKNALQKDIINILRVMVKSLGIHIVKANDFGYFDAESYNLLLKTFDLLNKKDISKGEVKDFIADTAFHDSRLQIKICDLIFKEFGNISSREVSRSTRPGKAILVSGDDFFDLRSILNAIQGKNIDVYTHSNLLISHSLDKFKQFKNLKGHYGDMTESCVPDFSTFPGAIVMTKSVRNNTDYLYRGRIFSTDFAVPSGIIRVENNDFSPVIEAALKSKGFKRGKDKQNITVGYNEKDITDKLKKLSGRLKNGEISRLFIIGMDAHSEAQKEYFREFFFLMKKDEFAVSFSYKSSNENTLTVNIGNYSLFETNIIYTFLKKYYPIDSEKLTFFCTTSDVMTISNIIMLKLKGAKNVYMNDCPPILLNPAAQETFIKEYNIKLITNARDDIKEIRTKKNDIH